MADRLQSGAGTDDATPARAAGVIAKSKAGRILMVRRTDGEGWAFPGGGFKEGEDAAKCAWREFFEETGYRCGDVGAPLMRRIKSGVDFTTFVCPVDDEFIPKLNHEHDAYAWVDPVSALDEGKFAGQPPSPVAVPPGLYADEFREEDHPRGEGEKGGQFVAKGAGGGGGGGGEKEAPKSEKPASEAPKASQGPSGGKAPAKGGEEDDPEIKRMAQRLAPASAGKLSTEEMARRFAPRGMSAESKAKVVKATKTFLASTAVASVLTVVSKEAVARTLDAAQLKAVETVGEAATDTISKWVEYGLEAGATALGFGISHGVFGHDVATSTTVAGIAGFAARLAVSSMMDKYGFGKEGLARKLLIKACKGVIAKFGKAKSDAADGDYGESDIIAAIRYLLEGLESEGDEDEDSRDDAEVARIKDSIDRLDSRMAAFGDDFQEHKVSRGKGGEKGGQFVKKGEEGVATVQPVKEPHVTPEPFEEPRGKPGPGEKALREQQKPRSPEEQKQAVEGAKSRVKQQKETMKQEEEQKGEVEHERAIDLEQTKQEGQMNQAAVAAGKKPKKAKVERKATRRTNEAPPPQGSGKFSGEEVRELTNYAVMRQATKPRGSVNKGRVGDELAAHSQQWIKDKLGFEDGRITRARAEADPAVNDLLATAISEEVKDELISKGKMSAQNWYREKFDQAINVAALIHPELKTSQTARTAFSIAMAITSQGQGVEDNAKFANQMYKGWKEKGEFDISTNPGMDKWDSGMKSNFDKINKLFKKYGDEDAQKFLAKEFKVSDLRSDGWAIANAKKDDIVYGSAIMGQKIGNGFFQNLSGNFTPVTQDMWFMRTFGRLTGTLRDVVDDKEGSYKRFKAAMKADGYDDIPDDADEEAIWKAAEARHAEHQKDYAGNRPAYDAGKKFIDDQTARLKTEAAKESKRTGKKVQSKKYTSIDKLLKDHPDLEAKIPEGAKFKSQSALASKSVFDIANGVQDNPGGGADRKWRSDVVNAAREKLAKQGIKLDNASLQAVIWYPEKDVFEQLGGKGEKSAETPDYAAALSKVAMEEGHDDADIQRAISEATAGARSGGGGGDGKSGGDGGAVHAVAGRSRSRSGDDLGGDRSGAGEHAEEDAGRAGGERGGPGGRRGGGAAGSGRQDGGRGAGPGNLKRGDAADLDLEADELQAISDSLDRLEGRLSKIEAATRG
jgi:8-oxo-dGTP pyrophosphatase MutT (NUDIX family)